MRICIYGAGAIGGYVAVKLAKAGREVSVVARGPHMEAIRERGLTLRTAQGEDTVRLPCSDAPEDLGPQDYVIVALKAHSVPAVARRLPALFHGNTAVLTAVNGLPWWYFHGLKGPYENHRLESVDPGGGQWTHIGPERAIGCAVYVAADVPEPGVVRHIEQDRFTLGEPSGETTERARTLAGIFRSAGMKAPLKARIRDEIWVKLWGNASFNPISALTHATLAGICRDPGTRAVARAMMVETQAVGEALGVRFGIDVDKRIAGAEAVGEHRTSMLQDLERGRPMEIDALVSSVAEVGRLVGVATPTIDMVLALVKRRASVAGCHGR